MDDDNELPEDVIPAEGPDSLYAILDALLLQVKANPKSLKKEFYILYKLGGQRSLIKVDMTRQPFQFWYYDLLGRPATEIVKNTIAKFLWEKCGERESYLRTHSDSES